MLHPEYLRVDAEELAARFAPVASGRDTGRDKYLTYYLKSIAAANALNDLPTDIDRKSKKAAETLGNQMQKDERFWIVDTLMSFYRSTDRIASFERLLTAALPDSPTSARDTAGWRDLIGDPSRLELFFEVNLRSPKRYQEWLRGNLASRSLVPWLTKQAAADPRMRLEGTTKVDAVLLASDTGFAVLFEAKVLSDTSCQVKFDATRNQIARNIDVMLEPGARMATPLSSRLPEHTYFVLITPELFRANPDTRLYGWLMNEYRNPTSTLLAKHLPWREAQLADVPQRLGWVSWEQCKEIEPDACPWL